MSERYFLSHKLLGEKEVTKEEWIKAERSAGFYPKCASSDPGFWTTCATGGFTGGGISGRVEYQREEPTS